MNTKKKKRLSVLLVLSIFSTFAVSLMTNASAYYSERDDISRNINNFILRGILNTK
ncbi:MAG: hypothetical protein FWF82_03225 [Oscillospiraceae bacterium]|nr:hypothetical protein [Oscillospiraceae bacterium]